MPTNITLSPELLAVIAGTLLSVAFGYIPKLKDWYSAKDPQTQAAIMGLLLLVSVIAIFLANCGAFLVVVNLTCTKQGAVDALWYFFYALMANQGTFMIAVSPRNKTLKLQQQNSK